MEPSFLQDLNVSGRELEFSNSNNNSNRGNPHGIYTALSSVKRKHPVPLFKCLREGENCNGSPLTDAGTEAPGGWVTRPRVGQVLVQFRADFLVPKVAREQVPLLTKRQ